MNFENQHANAQQLDSVEIYEFTTSTTVYRYTSHDHNLTIGGNVYTAVPINRSGFTRDVNLRVVTCQIRAPISTFFQQYIASTPIIPVQVSIKKFFITDLTEYQYVFNGVIISATIKGHMAEVECTGKGYELKEHIPHVFYQSYCNNVLFGPVCGLDASLWTFGRGITNIENGGVLLTIDSPVFLANLGTIIWNGDSRLITKEESATKLVIQFGFQGLAIGDTVSFRTGCDKSPAICANLYNNINNFVGFPYIPQGKNPTLKPVK